MMGSNTVENLHRRNQAFERADKERYNSAGAHSFPLCPWFFVQVKMETLNVLFLFVVGVLGKGL